MKDTGVGGAFLWSSVSVKTEINEFEEKINK